MSTPNPASPSTAYAAMATEWETIDDILAGPATIRSKTIRYLPQYDAEAEQGGYERRVKSAPWLPEFADILNTLSSKPFSKEVALTGSVSGPIKALAEDIDARGNNLTAFARSVFRRGIAKGLHAILVDYPSMRSAMTLADEKAAGARPYWISVRAEDIVALYTDFVGGREIVTHVRIKECVTERQGFSEATIERVRILEPGRWELWQKGEGQSGEWSKIGEGLMSLPLVPLALFWTGEREGPQFVRPPLAALADKQIELYRALSRKEEILTYAGSPMLCAQGIAAPKAGDKLSIGPKRVLFAPPGADGKQTGWSYVQPDPDNLKEIREDVAQTVDDMRRLGMQPLTQKSGDVTATASSIEGAKAHSVVEAWALGLKDVIEQALVFTAQWLGEKQFAEVDINTDFSVEPYAQAPLDALVKARMAGEISRETFWGGLRRFDVLSPDFDPEAEEGRLEDEGPALGTIEAEPEDEEEVIPEGGQPKAA